MELNCFHLLSFFPFSHQGKKLLETVSCGRFNKSIAVLCLCDEIKATGNGFVVWDWVIYYFSGTKESRWFLKTPHSTLLFLRYWTTFAELCLGNTRRAVVLCLTQDMEEKTCWFMKYSHVPGLQAGLLAFLGLTCKLNGLYKLLFSRIRKVGIFLLLISS